MLKIFFYTKIMLVLACYGCVTNNAGDSIASKFSWAMAEGNGLVIGSQQSETINNCCCFANAFFEKWRDKNANVNVNTIISEAGCGNWQAINSAILPKKFYSIKEMVVS